MDPAVDGGAQGESPLTRPIVGTALLSAVMLGSSVLVGMFWPVPVPEDVVRQASLGVSPGAPEALGAPVAGRPSPQAEDRAGAATAPRALEPLQTSFGPEAVAPYFTEGKQKDAKRAFDQHRYRDTLKLLQAEGDAPPVRYLRGLSALKVNDFTLAARELSEAARTYGALRDRCHYLAGQAYERLGAHAQADLELSAVRPGTTVYDDALLLLSKVRGARGDRKGALSVLEPLLDEEEHGQFVRAKALLAKANLARDGKDKQTERQALLSLWAENPGTSFASLAASRLGAIPDSAKVMRAEAVVDAHHNKDGLKQLRPLLKRLPFPSEPACHARVVQGKALRKERRHSEAIAALEPVISRCEDKELRARALYGLGASQAVVDPQAAIRTYERLAADHPEHSFADDALYSAAELEVMLDKTNQAHDRLAKVGELYPEGDHAPDALFKQFWLSWKNDPATSELQPLERLDRMSAKLVTGVARARARYWMGRALEARGQSARAAEWYERAARNHAGTFHGQMARVRLTDLDPMLAQEIELESQRAFNPAPGQWRIAGAPPSADEPLAAGVELHRLGMPEARRELIASAQQELAPSSVRLLFHLLDASGDTGAAYGLARAAVRGELGEMSPENALIWSAAFPPRFRPAIEKNAGKASVDPNLLQALVREESAFGPTARSGAGALGLTQLMPDTAAQVARKLGLRRPKVQSLFDPNLNLRLGARYLGDLLRRFDGKEAFAVASYNAGPNRVARWARVRADVELDEWVEEIPIDETRGYVQRVLSSYRIYSMREGDGGTMSASAGQR